MRGYDMALKRMDNILIVVEDLEAAKVFFVELGTELEEEMTVEGQWVDRIVIWRHVPALLHSRS
jgi:predicted lactoylglutathione lyase